MVCTRTQRSGKQFKCMYRHMYTIQLGRNGRQFQIKQAHVLVHVPKSKQNKAGTTPHYIIQVERCVNNSTPTPTPWKHQPTCILWLMVRCRIVHFSDSQQNASRRTSSFTSRVLSITTTECKTDGRGRANYSTQACTHQG